MATYTELAGFVKDWSNRDTGVLSYDTIRQCIRYAHDETYRTLRVAPLEVTRSGTVTASQVNDGFLRIEDDLVEFIQLRKRADEGPRSYSSFDKPYIVAEAHADARSFNGDTVTLYSDYAFYREGTEIHIFPLIQEGEVWELFYYRRLPEVNERFDIQEVVNLAKLVPHSITNPGDYSKTIDYFSQYDSTDKILEDDAAATIDGDSRDDNDEPLLKDGMLIDSKIETFTAYDILDAINIGLGRTDPDDPDEPSLDFDDIGLVSGMRGSFIGILKEHWLRDINEKVLLFGALHQAFDYLDEADQSAKYKGKFEQEIAKLNKEEMDRMNSGGNINVNFYNRLI